MNDPSTLDSPAKPLTTDDALVQRARAGDTAAFGALMQVHYESVFRLIVGIVRQEQDARELCQDVWVTAWQRLETFRGDSKFTTWLHPIAVRRALDHLRKRRRWFSRFIPFRNAADHDGPETDVAPEPVDPGLDAPTRLELAERRAAFDRLLTELPPLPRTVLVLREVQGLSYEDIARHLDCPIGTVMSRLYHARRLLARQLKDLP